MEDFVDWTKPIQTKNGRKARLLGELKTPPVETASRVVAVEEEGGYESVDMYFENGNYFLHEKDHRDIINVPPRKLMREVEAWGIILNGKLIETNTNENFIKGRAKRLEGTYVRLTGTHEIEVV